MVNEVWLTKIDQRVNLKLSRAHVSSWNFPSLSVHALHWMLSGPLTFLRPWQNRFGPVRPFPHSCQDKFSGSRWNLDYDQISGEFFFPYLSKAIKVLTLFVVIQTFEKKAIGLSNQHFCFPTSRARLIQHSSNIIQRDLIVGGVRYHGANHTAHLVIQKRMALKVNLVNVVKLIPFVGKRCIKFGIQAHIQSSNCVLFRFWLETECPEIMSPIEKLANLLCLVQVQSAERGKWKCELASADDFESRIHFQNTHGNGSSLCNSVAGSKWNRSLGLWSVGSHQRINFLGLGTAIL